MEQQPMITVILGPNGSGKTQMIERMRRQLASDKVRYVAFSDAYGPATDRAYYLQLRWNQHDIDKETPTVGHLLEKRQEETGEKDNAWTDHLYDLFDIRPMLDKYVILLSSGELRKFQLVKTLLSHPTTLILDNPFIGLDAQTRQQLSDLLLKLTHEQQLRLYLVLSRSNDVPPYADEIINTHLDEERTMPTPQEIATSLATLPAKEDDYAAPVVIDMHNVSIRYGERTILRNLDWQVRNNERWALLGQNGSGKSTLLSLVCADNPQSYACDISLFGNQRGSGETIWDIKRHIGYVSPEMHRSYLRPLPAIQVVASGLKDTVGLYVRPTEAEKAQCRWWMRVFGIEQLAERSFTQLSSGEQRMVLVTRAFVKDPQLIILDEPLHGLDDHNRLLVRNIIEAYCQRPNKTLIMVTHYEEELPQCINNRFYLTRQ